MTWFIHPAKDKLTKAVLSLVFIFTFLVFIFIFYGALLAFLGFAFLFVSLQSFYFKTSYELNNEFVVIRTIFGVQKRKLSEFKKIYRGKNGILLSPFKHKTFLNNFRGIFLYYPHDAAINEKIAGYLEQVFVDDEKTIEPK